MAGISISHDPMRGGFRLQFRRTTPKTPWDADPEEGVVAPGRPPVSVESDYGRGGVPLHGWLYPNLFPEGHYELTTPRWAHSGFQIWQDDELVSLWWNEARDLPLPEWRRRGGPDLRSPEIASSAPPQVLDVWLASAPTMVFGHSRHAVTGIRFRRRAIPIAGPYEFLHVFHEDFK